MYKLLFITWSVSYGYGTERSLADILNNFDQSIYDISILPLFKNGKQFLFNDNIKILDSLIDFDKEYFNELDEYTRYYNLLNNPSEFNKQYIKESYDCIIACNHNAPSYFASYIPNTPNIVWIRGDLKELAYQNSGLFYSKMKKEFETQKLAFKQFDAIVVISKVAKDNLESMFEITENVYFIPNSVDEKSIIELGNVDIGLPNLPIVSSIGRLDENKNQLLLLESVKLLTKKRHDFVVYLVGDGDSRHILERYIEKNNLKDNVFLTGFQENPYPYLKKSIMSVLTSKSEGFALVLVESIMLNTPIVSTDVGIAKELIDKYHCGEIIKNNPVDLANVIDRYVEDYYDNKVKDEIILDNAYYLEKELNDTCNLINEVILNNKKNNLVKLDYPIVKTTYELLKDITIPFDNTYILEVDKDGVNYEYLITRKSTIDKLVIFNNSAFEVDGVNFPVFQHHSWVKMLKTSSIHCMDPTIYLGDLRVGWGIGKNSTHYLENSANIVKILVDKMNIDVSNTAIFGTSAGGFLSILMASYIQGTAAICDNPQLDITRWVYNDAVNKVINVAFDNRYEVIKYYDRFNVIDTFLKLKYIPKIYMYINGCSTTDNSSQLIPFLNQLEACDDDLKNNDIEINIRYEPGKDHCGLESKDVLHAIYKVLDI